MTFYRSISSKSKIKKFTSPSEGERLISTASLSTISVKEMFLESLNNLSVNES